MFPSKRTSSIHFERWISFIKRVSFCAMEEFITVIIEQKWVIKYAKL